MNIKLRILDSKRHEATIEVLKSYNDGLEVIIDNRYVEYKNLTDTDIEIINDMIDREVYRKHGDELQDYDFQEIIPISGEDITCFEDYYHKHKDSIEKTPPDTRRMHGTIHRILYALEQELSCKNQTLMASSLVQYGSIKLLEYIAIEEFDIIKKMYHKTSIGSFIKNSSNYDGAIESRLVLEKLKAPAICFHNERCKTLDNTIKSKVFNMYHNEFVHKILGDLRIFGFEGQNGGIDAINFLFLIAIKDTDFIRGIGKYEEIDCIVSNTIECIRSIYINDNDWIKFNESKENNFVNKKINNQGA